MLVQLLTHQFCVHAKNTDGEFFGPEERLTKFTCTGNFFAALQQGEKTLLKHVCALWQSTNIVYGCEKQVRAAGQHPAARLTDLQEPNAAVVIDHHIEPKNLEATLRYNMS